METPAWRLSDDPPPKEIEQKGVWWFMIVVPGWIDNILGEQMVMLYFERDHV